MGVCSGSPELRGRIVGPTAAETLPQMIFVRVGIWLHWQQDKGDRNDEDGCVN